MEWFALSKALKHMYCKHNLPKLCVHFKAHTCVNVICNMFGEKLNSPIYIHRYKLETHFFTKKDFTHMMLNLPVEVTPLSLMIMIFHMSMTWCNFCPLFSNVGTSHLTSNYIAADMPQGIFITDNHCWPPTSRLPCRNIKCKSFEFDDQLALNRPHNIIPKL